MAWTVTAYGAAPPRKRLNGTAQQKVFWNELLTGEGNILLEARAGSGKSTAAREGMWRLLDAEPSQSIRYACFNKKIADDFRDGCPVGAEVGTMHSFAYRVLKRTFGCQVDAEKSYKILDQIDGGEKLPRRLRKSIATLAGLAKNHGYRPDGPLTEQVDLLADLMAEFDVEPWGKPGLLAGWTAAVLKRSAETTAIVDFDDMLWLAVLHQPTFPEVDYIFVDECQDTNRVQVELIDLLCPSGRIVAIGDPRQAIYAFRGADCESIAKLRDRFRMQTLPLTMSFRCPRSHVALARRLVPDFEAAPGAVEGELYRTEADAIGWARPGDLVLCRTNAPLIRHCLHAISRRIPAVVRGRAVGEQLLTVLRVIGDCRSIRDLITAVDRWETAQIERLLARDGTETQIESVADRAGCLRAIAETCSLPSEVPVVIAELFDDTDDADRICFSSVHRAKGAEARNVTFIQIPYSAKRDQLRPPRPWELTQRENLSYVGLTRSLHTLTLVTPEKFA